MKLKNFMKDCKRKRPTIFEAIRFPDNGVDQCQVADLIKDNGGELNLYDGMVEENIKTSTECKWRYISGSLEDEKNIVTVNIGDYVIKESCGSESKFYPCKSDIYEKEIVNE